MIAQRRSLMRMIPGLLAVVAAGCAAPMAQAPGPAARVLTPPAEELESFPLVREHPAVAAHTATLARAKAADRPALLMRRVRDAIAAAQELRGEQGTLLHFPGWAPDYERYLAFYDLAVRDLDEILAVSPDGPEAPEALFTMGMVHDYPHLDLFDVAVEAYEALVRRFPGSSWAVRARQRLEILGEIMDLEGSGPHDGFGTPAGEGP